MKKIYLISLLIALCSVSGCIDDVLAEEIQLYSYDLVDEAPGVEIVVGGKAYNIFKVPVYDAETGSIYHLKLPVSKDLTNFNITISSKNEVMQGATGITGAHGMSISGHEALIIKNCGYQLNATQKNIYCYSMIFMKIGNLVLSMELAPQEQTQEIILTDYDFTDESIDTDNFIYSPESIIDEFIDYISVLEVVN